MKYKGMELKEFTSDKPVIFDPPKKMLVWDCEGNTDSVRVLAYLPSLDFPTITTEGFHYRHCAEIPEEPKPRRATNRELIKWLAQGNGLCKHRLGSTVQDNVKCDKIVLDNECNPNWRVRKWDDEEWHEPTVDYMGLEDLA